MMVCTSLPLGPYHIFRNTHLLLGITRLIPRKEREARAHVTHYILWFYAIYYLGSIILFLKCYSLRDR